MKASNSVELKNEKKLSPVAKRNVVYNSPRSKHINTQTHLGSNSFIATKFKVY